MAPIQRCATTAAGGGSAGNNTHRSGPAGKVSIPPALDRMAAVAQLLQVAGIVVAVVTVLVIDLRESGNG